MDKVLANNVKILLSQQGKKQKELAGYLGVDSVTVNRWLNNKRRVKAGFSEKIAEFLGVKEEDLYNPNLKTSKVKDYNIEYDEYLRVVMERENLYRKMLEEEKVRSTKLEEKITDLEKRLEKKQNELMKKVEELSEVKAYSKNKKTGK